MIKITLCLDKLAKLYINQIVSFTVYLWEITSYKDRRFISGFWQG